MGRHRNFVHFRAGGPKGIGNGAAAREGRQRWPGMCAWRPAREGNSPSASFYIIYLISVSWIWPDWRGRTRRACRSCPRAPAALV